LFVALSTAGTILMVAAVSYLPLLLVDQRGVSEENAAALLAVVYLVGIFANMGVGFLTDRFSRKSILILTLLAAAVAAAVLNAAPFLWGVFSLLVIFGVLIVILQNLAESMIMTGVAGERCSSVLGTYYFATIAGGGLFTPLLGAFIDRQGFAVSYAALAVMLGVAGAGYWLWRGR
jgi:MFS family permease